MIETASCISGSCACGRIKFHTTAPPHEISYCYCRQCAKVTGAGYLPVAHFVPSAIQWTRQPDIWKSSKIAERGMCQACGTTLSMTYAFEPDNTCLAMGTFDQVNVALPKNKLHIFLKDKADWVQVPNDGARRFDGHQEEFQKQIDDWYKKAQ